MTVPDWEDLRDRLSHERSQIQHHGHDWDVADIVEVVRDWLAGEPR